MSLNTSTETAESLFNEGVTLYEQRRFSEAEEKLQKALRLLPSSEDIMYNLAMVYLQLQKYNLAWGLVKDIKETNCDDLIAALKEAAKKNPSSMTTGDINSPHTLILKDDFHKYINILEYCPFEDVEETILGLKKLTDARAIIHILPYLNSLYAYYDALTTLEELGYTDLVDHIVSVISGRTDQHGNSDELEALDPRLPKLLQFLMYSALCRHETVVSALIKLLRYKTLDLKALDLDEELTDLRKTILMLLGKTEAEQALLPLYAHVHASSSDLRNQAIYSIMELDLEPSITCLYFYLTSIKSMSRDALQIGTDICEYLVSSCHAITKEAEDAVESFCNLFEENSEQFKDISKEIRSRLQKVMTKIGRKYQKYRPCFLATAAYGSELAREVVILRRFRDEILLTRWSGRLFVMLYECVSPRVARWIAKKEKRKSLTRNVIIKPLVRLVG